MSKKEIERKWLLKDVPSGLTILGQHIVHQSYIIAEDVFEVRITIRHDVDTYDNENGPIVNKRKLTIKKGNGLVRDEGEIKLTDKQMEKLLPHAESADYITKVFSICALPDSDLTFELSEVDPGRPTSFMYAEVEFPDEETAAAFSLPDNIAACVKREVTGENSWQMKNYWRRTRMGKV